jgi:hypothetical protein
MVINNNNTRSHRRASPSVEITGLELLLRSEESSSSFDDESYAKDSFALVAAARLQKSSSNNKQHDSTNGISKVSSSKDNEQKQQVPCARFTRTSFEEGSVDDSCSSCSSYDDAAKDSVAMRRVQTATITGVLKQQPPTLEDRFSSNDDGSLDSCSSESYQQQVVAPRRLSMQQQYSAAEPHFCTMKRRVSLDTISLCASLPVKNTSGMNAAA